MDCTEKRASQLVLQHGGVAAIRLPAAIARLQLGDLSVDRRHGRFVRLRERAPQHLAHASGRPIMTSIQSGTELATSFIACTRDLKVSAM
jgi:hypothetical protein